MKSAGANAGICSSPVIKVDTSTLSNIGISPKRTVNTNQRHLLSLIPFINTSLLSVVLELVATKTRL